MMRNSSGSSPRESVRRTLGHVGAAHSPDRALPVAARHRLAQTLAIEEALHGRQEGDELVVVPFLELLRIAELVTDLVPGIVGIGFREVFPVLSKGHTLLKRQQMHRPEEDLAQMPDLLHFGCGPGARPRAVLLHDD